MTDSSRGQSETVGIVLLTAVIVVVVSVLGAGILSSGPQSAERPLVDLDIDISASTVTITHTGGDTVDGASLDVVIRNETASQRNESVVTGQFKPTDTVSLSHTLNGTVTVLVIDTGSNSVLGRDSQTPDIETAAAAGMPAIEPGEAAIAFHAVTVSDGLTAESSMYASLHSGDPVHIAIQRRERTDVHRAP